MSIETEYGGAAAEDEVISATAATLIPSHLAGNGPQPRMGDGVGDEADCPTAPYPICAEAGTSEADYPRQPKKGTFFDENVDLHDSAGDTLTMKVVQLIAEVEDRDRKRRPVDEANHRALVRRVLANGLRCRWFRHPPCVSYIHKPDHKVYQDKSSKPAWFRGPALDRTICHLVRAGLVAKTTGVRDIASSYVLTTRLLELAEQAGVSAKSLAKPVPDDRSVRLYPPKETEYDTYERRLKKHRGDEIPFPPTVETAEWTATLKAYNAFLAEQTVEVELPPELEMEWTEKLNSDERHTGASLRRPELIQTDLYRVFNNGSADNPTFNEGGRMAGGWWMNAPREVRPHITINGQPTIELDYKACHPNMLYHERGRECEGEAYEVPEVKDYEERNGLERETYREGLKWLMQVLINGKGRPSLADRRSDAVLPPEEDIPLREVIRMIKDRHEPIADSFETGAGMRLMRLESDIALSVITQAKAEGWLALPIHDSFVVAAENEERLRSLMEEEYMKVFHFRPTIKKG